MDSSVFDYFPSPRDPNDSENYAIAESLNELRISLQSYPAGIAEESIKEFLRSRHDNWEDVYEVLTGQPNIIVYDNKLYFEADPYYNKELTL